MIIYCLQRVGASPPSVHYVMSSTCPIYADVAQLDIYSHVLPGLQEAAAEKFDHIFDVDDNENSDSNVSKMLAKSEDLGSRPCRSRTCDTLIKSQVLIFSQLLDFLNVNPLRIKPSF